MFEDRSNSDTRNLPKPNDVRRALRRVSALCREKIAESRGYLDGSDPALTEDAAADVASAEELVAELFT